LNPEHLMYEMVFTDLDEIGYDKMKTARKFVEGK